MIIRFIAFLSFLLFSTLCVLSNDIRFGELYSLSRQSIDSSLELSIDYAKKAELAAQTMEELAKVYWLLGYLNELDDNTGSAVKYYYAGIRIYSNLGQSAKAAKLSENIGTIALDYGIYEMAERAYLRRLEFSEITGDSRSIAEAYFDLGLVYKSKMELEKSVHFFLTARKLIAIEGVLSDTTFISRLYNELGIVNYMIAYAIDDSSFLDSAKQYYEKAMNLSSAPINQFQPINNIGNLYLKEKELDKAKAYLLKAIKLAESIPNKRILIPAFNNLGILYFELGDAKLADSLFRRSLDLNLKEYTTKEIISDKKALISFNNTPELRVTYKYLDLLASLEDSDTYALLQTIKKYTLAEKTLDSETVKDAIRAELYEIDRENQANDKRELVEKLIQLVSITLFFSAIILFLVRHILKARKKKKEIQQEVDRISKKLDV